MRNKNLELSFELMVLNLHFKRGKLFRAAKKLFLMEPSFDQRSEDPGLGLGHTKKTKACLSYNLKLAAAWAIIVRLRWYLL